MDGRREPTLEVLNRAYGGAPAGATMLVATPLWWLTSVIGVVTAADASTGPTTAFIVNPDGWSFAVAVLAGIAGVLSLTTDKSGPLVGVFISVTTVPAAGYAVVAAVAGEWNRCVQSVGQLLVNLLGIVAAAAIVLIVRRNGQRSPVGMRPLSRG